MRFSKAVVKYRIPILILTLLLLIPSVIGMTATRVGVGRGNGLPVRVSKCDGAAITSIFTASYCQEALYFSR